MKDFERLASEPRYEPELGRIFFEISNGEARQACSIEVSQQDEALALAFFHTNWPIIGKMAREAMTAGKLENGEVRLVAPKSIFHS